MELALSFAKTTIKISRNNRPQEHQQTIWGEFLDIRN